jgi:hypothetical protein
VRLSKQLIGQVMERRCEPRNQLSSTEGGRERGVREVRTFFCYGRCNTQASIYCSIAVDLVIEYRGKPNSKVENDLRYINRC